jgi:hypothetical protein
MKRRAVIAVLALAAAGTTAAVALAAHATILATPSTVHLGGVVTVHGNAGGCPVGDTVTLMSRAFATSHSFAGIPAVYAKVRAHDAFSTKAHIRRHIATGRYAVTARCGGGNFGVSATLHVLH